ncbi:uncharacterized protein LOC127693051 isoform X9 [Apodemus sylvaticus]|uniref:uncharacterized protein LOC127693051 isoform X9 n=1 Tax=Apodemus sylvaticus TaxID=10129 RepID=UPI002242E039|nr:uncharacterized protein LOC127693051 isoform X9 [Apodemus sylvaticus]
MPRACVVKKLFSESSWSFPASALPLPQPSYRALPTRFAVLIGCNLCRSKSGVRAPSLPTCRQAPDHSNFFLSRRPCLGPAEMAQLGKPRRFES